ncbi:retrovirus-related pol polyprotein from transposon TNT 1-94 [Tanacetum coccineum]
MSWIRRIEVLWIRRIEQARIRSIFLDGYGILRCQNIFFKCLRLGSKLCNQNALETQEYFEQNVLQAQLHAKDTVISKLKETIHSLRDNANPAKLHKEKELLKKTYKELYDSIKLTRVHAKEQCDSLIANLNSKSMENADLKAQILEKVFANEALKNELRKLKGKNMINIAISKPNATTIAPGMFKLDIEPISHILKNNRVAHEQLVYVSKKCPSLTKPSEKLVVVTPKNKEKKVRFADPITSSSNTQKQVDSHNTQDSNKPLFHSTGVIYSTGASGSKTTSNTKNNRISQPSSSNKKNKVEEQSRSVKTRTNKKNRVSKTECNVDVIHSMLNANSKYVCAICNEYLFEANHDKCVLDYVHDVNLLSKSKPAKRKNKKQIWKPTVPLKETTTKSVLTLTLGIKVYSRRPKATKSIDSSSKSKIIKSRISNSLEPTQAGESTVSNVPSSSLIDCRSKDEAPEFIIKFLKMIQVYLNTTVKNIRTDNGIEFVNQTMRSYYEDVDISHETSVACTPQQNSAEVVATACYTENRSLIRLHHGKTPYELMHDRKPDLSYLHVFDALCYLTNDSEDLGKLKAKADVGIFIRYAPAKKAYWIYNKRTRRIMETIHVDFDELTAMDSE